MSFNCEILYYGKSFSVSCTSNDRVEKLLSKIDDYERKSQDEKYDPRESFIVEHMYEELDKTKTFLECFITYDTTFTVLIDTKGKPAPYLGTCFECTSPLYYNDYTKVVYKCEQNDYKKVVDTTINTNCICPGPAQSKITHKLCMSCKCSMCEEVEEILEMNETFPEVVDSYIKKLIVGIEHLNFLNENLSGMVTFQRDVKLSEITTIEQLDRLANEKETLGENIKKGYSRVASNRADLKNHEFKKLDKFNQLLLAWFWERPYNLEEALGKEKEWNRLKDKMVRINEELGRQAREKEDKENEEKE